MLESIWLKQNVSLLIESIWLKQNVSFLLEWIWLKQNVSLLIESIWLKQNISLLLEWIWLKQNVSLLIESIWLKQNVSLLLEWIWLKQNVSLLIESIWLKQNVNLLLEWIWLKQNVSLRLGHTTSKAKSELFKICPVDMKLTIHSEFCISVLSADVIPNCRCSFHFLLSIEHKRLNSWHQFAFYCDLLIKQIDLVTHIWDARGVLQYRSPTYIIVSRIWDASVLFIMQVDIRLRTMHRSKCSASRLWNVGTTSCLNAIVSHWIGFNE